MVLAVLFVEDFACELGVPESYPHRRKGPRVLLGALGSTLRDALERLAGFIPLPEPVRIVWRELARNLDLNRRARDLKEKLTWRRRYTRLGQDPRARARDEESQIELSELASVMSTNSEDLHARRRSGHGPGGSSREYLPPPSCFAISASQDSLALSILEADEDGY